MVMPNSAFSLCLPAAATRKAAMQCIRLAGSCASPCATASTCCLCPDMKQVAGRGWCHAMASAHSAPAFQSHPPAPPHMRDELPMAACPFHPTVCLCLPTAMMGQVAESPAGLIMCLSPPMPLPLLGRTAQQLQHLDSPVLRGLHNPRVRRPKCWWAAAAARHCQPSCAHCLLCPCLGDEAHSWANHPDTVFP